MNTDKTIQTCQQYDISIAVPVVVAVITIIDSTTRHLIARIEDFGSKIFDEPQHLKIYLSFFLNGTVIHLMQT